MAIKCLKPLIEEDFPYFVRIKRWNEKLIWRGGIYKIVLERYGNTLEIVEWFEEHKKIKYEPKINIKEWRAVYDTQTDIYTPILQFTVYFKSQEDFIAFKLRWM